MAQIMMYALRIAAYLVSNLHHTNERKGDSNTVTVFLIGLNHRTTPVELREKLFITNSTVPGHLRELMNIVQESVIVSTCNRLEVYGVAATDVTSAIEAIMGYLCDLYDISPEVLRNHLYIRDEKSAMHHLGRVASGLDSMILGETQILGQVVRALALAQQSEAVGPILNRLFTQAIHSSKRAHAETEISRHTVSISHAAALLAHQQFEDIADAKVVVIGAGEMAELAIKAFVGKGATNVCIVNRTCTRADNLAHKVGVSAITWDRLHQSLIEADIVVSATSAPHLILSKDEIQQVMSHRSDRNLICVDIAVPRDIDAEVDEIPGVVYHDIDDLSGVVDESLAQRQACVPAAEKIIDAEMNHYQQWLKSRKVVPVITGLRGKIQAIADAEVEQALHRLENLDTHDHEVILRLAHRIVNKVLHEPTTCLKAHAANGDGDHLAGVVSELFALQDIEETLIDG